MQVPSWWLTVSGIFFVVAILALIGSCVALYFAVNALKEVSARMQTLSAKVEDAIGEVRQITRTVGGNVGSITQRVDSFTAGATKKLELFSTLMMLFSTAKKMGLFSKSSKRSPSQDQ